MLATIRRRCPAAGDVGDIHRFAGRDKFASWNGTAPLDASSGNQERHRLSRAGNRRINRTLQRGAMSGYFGDVTAVTRNCPEMAMKLPAGGHENCLAAAMRSARHV
jgi:Transposase IS116/IS110/IS902 family